MKFSIRDLMLVTVIAALVLGWWVRGLSTAAQRQIEKDAHETEIRICEGELEHLRSENKYLFDSIPPTYGLAEELTLAKEENALLTKLVETFQAERTEIQAAINHASKMPISSAPAPNPPKP